MTLLLLPPVISSLARLFCLFVLLGSAALLGTESDEICRDLEDGSLTSLLQLTGAASPCVRRPLLTPSEHLYGDAETSVKTSGYTSALLFHGSIPSLFISDPFRLTSASLLRSRSVVSLHHLLQPWSFEASRPTPRR
ncbi:unnamed protein product [Microthlaspi erraticum]|uniref:Uncharacterized protein n=1 Tax=Microthlaspi erraticum TaxID=1685480 RepID=A0A6D2KCN6_9BRAS|nr:unnamed protein product [Microthlaspi erraticum]CAA7045875.1 unnamed protein product [Microthlaspi erraticum]